MDYEKLYKETINKLRKLHDDWNSTQNRAAKELEFVLPELRESEDEKIRKGLIEHLKELKEQSVEGSHLKRPEHYDTWISWIEKQGNQDNNEDVDILQRFSFYSYKDEPNVLYFSGLYVNEEYRNKGIGTKILKIADKVSTSMECNYIRLKTESGGDAERLYKENGYNTLKKEGNQVWLEKKGEQKPINMIEPKFKPGDKIVEKDIYECGSGTIKEIRDGKYIFEDNCFIYIKEQDLWQLVKEPVEPKFKVGDWVVNKLGNVWHINGFDKKNYQVSNGDKYNYFPISKQDEMHLWTINDAEDGDVLYFSDETIVIFKDLYNATTFHSYCHIEDGLFAVSKDDMPDWWEGKVFQPANKEQCDFLFQKMKENGYEWDAEKKELNKIEKQGEQKLVDMIEPKFKVGDWVRAISSGNIFKILSVNDGLYRVLCYDGVEANYPIIDVDYDLVPWTIQDAKDGDVLATKKGNPFIYDKDRYNNGLAYYYAGLDVNKELTLKSPHHMLAHFGELSGVFPATKEQRDILFQKMKEAGYEWNAEKKELKSRILAWSEKDEKKTSLSDYDLSMIDNLVTDENCPLDSEYISWLKSLKDRVQHQPKQEWSEEDKLALKQAIYVCNQNGYTAVEDWLKSLKPNNWKPSEEQMEALVIAVHDAHGRSYYEKLFSIYNYLKTL